MQDSSKDRMGWPIPAGTLFRRTQLRRLICLLLLGTGLSGCAPALFRDIRKEITPNVTVGQVASDPATFIGKKVLWGGVIVRSENMADKTILEVIEAPLTRYARPANLDRSGGRFIIEHEGFLDIAVYAEGRVITVAGEILGTREGKIGERNYTFPLLRDIKLHLWEKRREEIYPSHIFLYDPFYYPFYGPYYYPYYRPGHPRRQPQPWIEPPRREPPPGHEYKKEKKNKKRD
ncbi:MAG: Slp family lipoprotein [Proteobacteria bacterium]|nr:Slp family lipoprotein [Pseudomonadota bacterium]